MTEDHQSHLSCQPSSGDFDLRTVSRKNVGSGSLAASSRAFECLAFNAFPPVYADIEGLGLSLHVGSPGQILVDGKKKNGL